MSPEEESDEKWVRALIALNLSIVSESMRCDICGGKGIVRNMPHKSPSYIACVGCDGTGKRPHNVQMQKEDNK